MKYYYELVPSRSRNENNHRDYKDRWRYKNQVNFNSYIIQPDNDKKIYKAVELYNGLQVLLISDPTTKVSAAALNISIGYINDPIQLQGLAHVFQHFLYLSSDKNSPAYKFFAEVKSYNGTRNAIINENDTTYFFEIDSDVFMRTLGKFSELFHFPAFLQHDEKYLEKELRLVLEEFAQMNSKSLEKHWVEEITTTIKKTIDESHEFTKSRGNEQLLMLTKNSEIIRYLRYFYMEHYSSNLMTLCIYGKENINVLYEHAQLLFGHIKNAQEPILTWIAPEFESVQKIWCSIPEQASSLYYTIRIVFPFSHLLTKEYKINAVSRFLSYLLEYNGKGTLISVLRIKNWATSVETGELPCSRGFSFFVVAISLTKKGYAHFDEVMTLFMQYIQTLSEMSDFEFRRIYNEYKEILELKFCYKKKETPLAMVCNRVRHINVKNINHILRHDIIPSVCSVGSLKHVLQSFWQPSLKLRIYLNHPSTLHKDAVLKEYGRIPCKIQLVMPEEYSKWLSKYNELNAPMPNKFIPLRTSLKPREPEERDIPRIIQDTLFIKTWYKRDNIFHEPKASAYLHFVCPMACKSAVNAHLTSLYVDLLNFYLDDHKHPAGLVDLRWELCTTVQGIMVKMNGFDDRLHVLLEEIVECIFMSKKKIKNFRAIFEVLAYRNKRWCKRNIDKFNDLQPYEQALRYLPFLLTERLWTPSQIWENDRRITWKEFNDYLSTFIESLHVECLFHGNILEAEALEMTSTIEKIINRRSKHVSPVSKFQLYREVKLKPRKQYMFRRETKHHANLCLLQFYQIDTRSIESDVLLDLAQTALQEVISRDCRNIAACGRHRGHSMQGLTILFLDPKMQFHEHVNRITQNVMMNMQAKVLKISDREFKIAKDRVAATRQRPETLYKLSDMYWHEILTHQYEFNRWSAERKYLANITRNDFFAFFKGRMSYSTPQLSIYVTSEATKALMKKINDLAAGEYQRTYDSEVVMINDCDIHNVKNQEYYQIPRKRVMLPPQQ